MCSYNARTWAYVASNTRQICLIEMVNGEDGWIYLNAIVRQFHFCNFVDFWNGVRGATAVCVHVISTIILSDWKVHHWSRWICNQCWADILPRMPVMEHQLFYIDELIIVNRCHSLNIFSIHRWIDLIVLYFRKRVFFGTNPLILVYWKSNIEFGMGSAISMYSELL